MQAARRSPHFRSIEAAALPVGGLLVAGSITAPNVILQRMIVRTASGLTLSIAKVGKAVVQIGLLGLLFDGEGLTAVTAAGLAVAMLGILLYVHERRRQSKAASTGALMGAAVLHTHKGEGSAGGDSDDVRPEEVVQLLRLHAAGE